ncbi:MAG: hypothetical protein QG653_607 [Patescibacteria group bacterium]|nr:hypothetical protein [Patescibacteria group bacterium]
MEIQFIFPVACLFLTYFAFGVFGYYLEHNKTITGLIRDIAFAKKEGRPFPSFTVGHFLEEMVLWPIYLRDTWVEKWKKDYLKRVDIILFLSVICFLILLYVALLLIPYLPQKILAGAVLWSLSGFAMYTLSSMYTNNQDEVWSDIGFVVSLLHATYGPFGYRRLREIAKNNIEFLDSHP